MCVLLALWAVCRAAPLVHSVEIRGTAGAVALDTQAGKPLDPAQVEKDVRRLWSSGRFGDVRVESSASSEGEDVVFRVTEKPRRYLREIQVDKKAGLTAPPVTPGTLADDITIARLVAMERKQLRQDGYAHPKVEAELIPAGAGQVDLHLRTDPGKRYVVREVRFNGTLGADRAELRHALRSTSAHRFSHPPFSEAALEDDVERLRSFYIGRGYFDAEVRVGGVEYAGERVSVTYDVRPGPRHPQAASIGNICRCLLDARRQAESEGRLDFDAELDVEATELKTRTGRSEPYTVGRIEFTGNHRFGDRVMRRALVLDEGAPFDADRLRQSMARINRLGLFEPLEETSVRVTRDAAARRAEVTFALVERKKGRWHLSGPVGPPSLAGPLEAQVALRVATTYFASVSLVAFNPLFKFLPFATAQPWLPMAAVSRPYLVGQGWQSGFMVSPQAGWQGMLGHYGVTHMLAGARAALGVDRAAAPDLPVPAGRGWLTCRPGKPRLWWARAAGNFALEWLGRAYLLGPG